MTPRIAIIGAGPAGSSCALRLAQRGFESVLVERQAFPRRKVCGEFISPAATAILESLLPPSELRGRGARRVGTFTIELDDRTSEWRMPTEAWVLSRTSLDDALLDRAQAAGVKVHQPARVSRVRYAADHVAVELASGEHVHADAVVHADGVGRFDDAGPTPMRRGVVGAKCHLRVPIEGIRMRCALGAYIGTVGVECGLSTLALVARSTLVRRHGGDFSALVRESLPAFDNSWVDGTWMSCGVAGSPYITPGHVRSFRVGNAAGAVEPVGGEGIGMALWAGSTLGTMLDPADLQDTQRRFAMAYRTRLRLRRPACRLAAETFMRPALLRTGWPILARMPGLAVTPWYAMTGKHSPHVARI
ncbi:MAG: FAD-dependent monooxygenase [Planctomycetota bacterium]